MLPSRVAVLTFDDAKILNFPDTEKFFINKSTIFLLQMKKK